MNFDELQRQMEQDELEDATTLTPREYAKLRGLYPQRVYRAIRDNKLKPERCGCGRKVIDIETADEVFKVGKWRPGSSQDLPQEEEVPGSDVDTDE